MFQFQVNLQADARFRQSANDIQRLEVRNAAGDMVPLGSVIGVEETFGPQLITRYNRVLFHVQAASKVIRENIDGMARWAARR